jgi:hypothetical protein
VGLYTGAGAPKSEAEAKLFGGAAGRPFVPCYHRACDTTENIDQEVLEQNVRDRAGAPCRGDRCAGTWRARSESGGPAGSQTMTS